ncbi:asparagine synthase (glutamine-hydrolyzing) [Pseudodesulfovibrio piezophilus]|uniref:asparagine synthase (glutamine-hydrolyzing) n=1 Tax=Pseudodesulfovibrio piezophilus (strain DSM 21447 / JCM 15486 / C1TLV30) TaxID=1322246 RepID=M1WT64_PSEP2|nr:asparagine synthase (glutamine-hydrolyzing) [Pseudodesulfovibrio piezophilus]CCH49302.1 putative amidotransferase [Pseudodesulfovibrio piezophilus C1TLV30]
MCGFLGIVASQALSIDRERFRRALNLQRHRGPDGSGVHWGPRHALGHRRLSIIDLNDRSAQPMCTEDGRFCLVFNGEIYNFKEIRSRLHGLGHRFCRESDTEVLLHAYEEWGTDCLEMMQGMFAFAVLDTASGKVVLARDRLGIKPLYYSRHGETLYFASEIKSILAMLDGMPAFNERAAASYLSFRQPLEQDTFYQGIHSLRPGHILTFDKERLHTIQWWDCAQCIEEQRDDKGEAFYADRLRELLTSSIRYRMISDVPVGAYLSGGVDSSAIATIMAGLSSDPVSTFTIGFTEDGYNEFPYARMVAEQAGTTHHEILLGSTAYMEDMERLIRLKDAPLSVPNEIPLNRMSAELKRHITVVLSGEGADELFWGYGRIFRSAFDYQRMVALENGEYPPQEASQLTAALTAAYGQAIFPSKLDHFLAKYRYVPLCEQQRLLDKDVVRSAEVMHRKTFSRLFRTAGDDYANNIAYAFTKIHLEGLLRRVDSSTMATSVEARVPFLDHRLVEFAFSVPSHHKLRWKSPEAEQAGKLLAADDISEHLDIPKYILKKSASKLLPHDILYRKKQGFPVPLDQWAGGDLKDKASEILLSQEARQRGLYEMKNMKKLVANLGPRTPHKDALKVWMLLNLEVFLSTCFTRPVL